MQYQLVLQFSRASLASEDFFAALETELGEALGDAAQIDGHDISARSINLFVLTADPVSSFRRAKPVLQQRELLEKVTAAHRLAGGARFTVLWPLRSLRKFKL